MSGLLMILSIPGLVIAGLAGSVCYLSCKWRAVRNERDEILARWRAIAMQHDVVMAELTDAHGGVVGGLVALKTLHGYLLSLPDSAENRSARRAVDGLERQLSVLLPRVERYRRATSIRGRPTSGLQRPY